jgi:hypothetical protein
MSDPSASHHPRMPGRTPGNHTPRHVQWASVVDEEQVASRQCDRDLDSEQVSAHELDTAGLDVCTVCSLLSYSLVLFFHSQPPFKHLPMLSSARAQPQYHLTYRPDHHNRIHPPR